MEIKSWFSTYQPTTGYKMKEFEIVDQLDYLGFPYLADKIASNECIYSEAIEHLNSCKNECTEEEFPSSVYDEVIFLIDLYFSL